MTPQELQAYFRKNGADYTRVYREVVRGFKGQSLFGVGVMPDDPSQAAIKFEHGYMGLKPNIPSGVTINGQRIQVIAVPMISLS